MNQPNHPFYVILGLTVILFAALSCSTGQEEQQTTLFDQYYRIDPATLIDSLKNGDMNAFTPVSEEPDILPVDQQLPLNWFQADYFHIANTLYEGVLGNSLEGWELNSMDFRLDCSKIRYGFQNGRFTFFKVAKEKEQEVRMSSFIDIDPRANFVRVKEEKQYPKLVDWKVIDMTHLKISADQALQIAESNGGKEKRKSVGNACYMSLILSPSPASDSGWIVLYTRNDELTSFFSVLIDPYTGQFRMP
jgi:hypothetical protein